MTTELRFFLVEWRNRKAKIYLIININMYSIKSNLLNGKLLKANLWIQFSVGKAQKGHFSIIWKTIASVSVTPGWKVQNTYREQSFISKKWRSQDSFPVFLREFSQALRILFIWLHSWIMFQKLHYTKLLPGWAYSYWSTQWHSCKELSTRENCGSGGFVLNKQSKIKTINAVKIA